MERVLRATFGLEEPLVRELGGRRGSSERSASDEQAALVVQKASFREVAATEARAVRPPRRRATSTFPLEVLGLGADDQEGLAFLLAKRRRLAPI
jgi:hypothetical protein